MSAQDGEQSKEQEMEQKEEAKQEEETTATTATNVSASTAATAASGGGLTASASGSGGGMGAKTTTSGSYLAAPTEKDKIKDAFPVGLSWKDVKFTAGDRKILHSLSGCALPGRMLMLAGPSGSGKTSLLKIIADRMRKEGSDRELTAELFINGVEFTDKHRSLISFVPQDDILNGLATAEETLRFNAKMRRGDLGEEETDKLVAETLKELRLHHVKDTVIGIPGITAGLSGGERKRANIGCESVHQPKVLLLDEPTTGLDTLTAFRIVKQLKELCNRGRTIICTLHQPTFDIMNLFDDFLLLVEGQVLYHGPMDHAVKHFAAAGYECPQDSTPTDYFLWNVEDKSARPKLVEHWKKTLEARNNPENVLLIGEKDSQQAQQQEGGVGEGEGDGDQEGGKNNKKARLEITRKDLHAFDSCLTVPYDQGPEKEETLKFLDDYYRGTDTPYCTQLAELFKRAFLNAMRNQMNIVATLLQSVLFGAFAGLLFMNLEPNTQGIADRFGLLFTMAVNTGFSGASAVINTFPAIKAVFLREQQAGAYAVGAFFMATFLADLPLQILAMTLQVIIVYFSTDLLLAADKFWIFWAIMIVSQQLSISMGLALSAASSNPSIAAVMVPALMTPMMLTGGFLTSTERLRPYWVWLERVSFIRMPFVLMAHNEFEDLGPIWCDAAKFGTRFCDAQPKNGTAVLSSFDLDSYLDSDWISWLTLFAILVFIRLLAWIALVRSAGEKE